MKIRINERYFFYLLLIVTPFIDLANALIHISGTSSFLSVGQITRIFILIIMFAYILRCNGRYGKYLLALIFALILHDLVYALFGSTNLAQNLSYNLRYIYVLSFGFALLTALQRQKISKLDLYRLIKIITSLVAIISLFSSFAGIGLDYAGTKRVFTEVNALTAILVIGCGLYVYEIVFYSKNISTIIMTLIMITATISQATKTGLIGVVVCGLFMYFYVGFVRKKFLKQFILLLFLGIAIIVLQRYYLQGNGTAILSRWKYFYNNMDIMSFLLSGRDNMLVTSFDIWIKHPFSVLFGLGFSFAVKLIFSINPTQNFIGAEMDVFDLFFYYGLFIGIAVSVPIFKNLLKCLKNLFKNNQKSYYNFLYIIVFFIMFLGGHVLNSPLAGLAFCLLFCLTYGDNNEKFGNDWISELDETGKGS